MNSSAPAVPISIFISTSPTAPTSSASAPRLRSVRTRPLTPPWLISRSPTPSSCIRDPGRPRSSILISPATRRRALPGT
ncbi:hypothetical protein EBR16_08770, partial [bacterium]|nr:hypothetical protein [bacterium]